MATSREHFGDTSAAVRRRFLEAVASARPPIRAQDLRVPGLDRRSIQKRLERLRRRAGSRQVGDGALVEYAREQLDELAGPVQRGLRRLKGLGTPLATAFAASAGLQNLVIGDWVELAHSPGDRGWSRSQVVVQDMARSSVLLRGRSQSWLREKKAYLKEVWREARRGRPELMRDLSPNQMKMDLVSLFASGTTDSPTCLIRVAPVDWLTCLALNARLDSEAVSRTGANLREIWGTPSEVVERRLLPGMIVAHIVVLTSDHRILVCQRQARGIHDEPEAWSLSIEERWSGRLSELRDREGRLVQRPHDADRHPHDLVRRAVREELGLEVRDEDVMILSWGIESSVLYPGFIALARTDVGSWQAEQLHSHAADASELRFVASVPAGEGALSLLMSPHFAPVARPELSRPWHRTSLARLFAALAHLLSSQGLEGREELLRRLGTG